MAISGLRGPYPLTTEGVNDNVTRSFPGAYALGRMANGSMFLISYVGRSDDDVNARLHDHVQGEHSSFKFEPYASAKAAFEKECDLYHDFSPPENKAHPARPVGTSWQCPRCDHQYG